MMTGSTIVDSLFSLMRPRSVKSKKGKLNVSAFDYYANFIESLGDNDVWLREEKKLHTETNINAFRITKNVHWIKFKKIM